MQEVNAPCICGSAKPYKDCCGPYLSGEKQAKTATQLMRSRYAAYALGGHRQYLVDTWHPASAGNTRYADLDNPNTVWSGLDIIRHEQKGDTATVEFKASYREGEGEEQCHHELSRFHRVKGRWYYLDGKIFEPADGDPKA